jgi:hypothetical protein
VLIVNVLTLPNASTKSGAKVRFYFILKPIKYIICIVFYKKTRENNRFALTLQNGLTENIQQLADSGDESDAEKHS